MTLLRRVLLVTALVVILAYGGAIVWLIARETTLVFRAGEPLGDRRPASPFRQVEIHSAERPRQPAWVIPAASEAAARPWVLFLHGQGSNLASRLNILHYDQLSRLGLNVLAPEYRGFGGVEGVPSEAGLAEDARAAYDYLRGDLHVDPRRIVIYGWSLGSAVAVTLSSQADEGAVILEGAPASVLAIGQQRYPYFPIRLLIRNPFDSIARIDRIGSPVLFIHSPEDTTIPIGEGRRLFAAAREPKQFVEVAGGHVYASERDPRFFLAVRRFLQAQRLLP
jgi:fermentation-respiration switch protein FrsA (DUF1100 family)